MNYNLQVKEKLLKENSKNSEEELLDYIMFELSSPIEDYWLALDVLKSKYKEIEDVRLLIIGAYLSSTWLNSDKNIFLEKLKMCKEKCNEQEKAIIYYLLAYDLYIKYDKDYPYIYEEYLRKSISYSERFVYNYVRLSEISTSEESKKLKNKAISNVEKIWSENELMGLEDNTYFSYESFLDEFILGVDISEETYNEIFN